ncbi:hypothetical protein PoB_005723400 [Plakobranchus ocellatus]|uniref:Uncharacterized protein n=1 Tax=Plakobranchus ocellatus TaxID=259542 RepID=A0AAV4CHQ1_9GAST|nr:hypothetical protein PoB_005723400 [Plakobranchus ocellatus]
MKHCPTEFEQPAREKTMLQEKDNVIFLLNRINDLLNNLLLGATLETPEQETPSSKLQCLHARLLFVNFFSELQDIHVPLVVRNKRHYSMW